MRRSCNRWCVPLAVLFGFHVFISTLVRSLSCCGFVHGAALRKSAITRSFGSVARRAEGQLSFKGANDASAVAAALNGKKIGGKKVDAKPEGATVTLSGLDGDLFGSAPVTGELFGVAKGASVSFNARKTFPETPLAVAFVDSETNTVTGMFLVGSGDGQPSSEELSLARKLVDSGAEMDLEGPIANLGLPKRWLKPLLGASSGPKGGSDEPPLLAIGIAVALALGVVTLSLGGSSSPSSETGAVAEEKSLYQQQREQSL